MKNKFKVGSRVASSDKPNQVKRIIAILPDGFIHCQWLVKGKLLEEKYESGALKLLARYLPLCVVQRLRL